MRFSDIMATKFKEGVSWRRKLFFHTYAYALNSTEIGVWSAAAITTSVACDVNVGSVVKQGATMAAFYLCPAAPAYAFIKGVDKSVAVTKNVAKYGSYAYKLSTIYTAPIELANYLGAKACTRIGATEGIKYFCGVEESDAFYWERPEYADRI